MRALAVFPDRRELRMIDVPEPVRRGEREVTVRIREVGICGTDREIGAFHYGAPAPGAERLVLGHEALGEVIEVGSSVSTLAPGDLVALTVRRPCDAVSCVACRAGRQDFCVSGRFVERGIHGADGYLTELVVEDERYLVKVPHGLAEVGVLIEPLTIAAKAAVDLDAILRRYPWEPVGLRALVLGAGPIGLLGAMMLVARNVTTFVYSREAADSDRGELTRSFGAEYVSAGDTPLSELPPRIGNADVVFEAVGAARVAFGALPALAPNGVFILSGVPAAGTPIEIDLDGIMRDIVLKNQVLFGTVNASRAAFEASVRQLEQFMGLFPDALRSLITHRATLEDAPELLHRPGGIKQVVSLAA
ncbi:MAG: zinc-binding dehydrogenase [Myxococcales bacterium 68-20]|nr:glucose 1-dehydrogenase [Myxococcales bacterium]OJY17143.1 MAG: zinc-binding dehydrogenase [Myxococcales bacterium 68-20]